MPLCPVANGPLLIVEDKLPGRCRQVLAPGNAENNRGFFLQGASRLRDAASSIFLFDFPLIVAMRPYLGCC